MKKLMTHLDAVMERRNVFELFFTVLWAFPVFLIIKLLNLLGVKTK
jgi:hypothetical protein